MTLQALLARAGEEIEVQPAPFWVELICILTGVLLIGLAVYRRWYDRPRRLTLDTEVLAMDRFPDGCRVTFRLAREEKASFPVPEELYKTLRPGDKGKLTLRGGAYLSFEKERNPFYW